jgi:transposase
MKTISVIVSVQAKLVYIYSLRPIGRNAKFIKNLTEEQKGSLQRGYSYGKSPLYSRKCHCILQSSPGKTAKQLAELFQVNKITVLHWFTLWEKEGIQGLKLKAGRGRKPKLNTHNPRHVAIVKELIENENQNLTKVRSQVTDQLGVELSKKTLQRFLKSLNTDRNGSVGV